MGIEGNIVAGRKVFYDGYVQEKDQKEKGPLLKAAGAYIRTKDYDNVIQRLESILKTDPQKDQKLADVTAYLQDKVTKNKTVPQKEDRLFVFFKKIQGKNFLTQEEKTKRKEEKKIVKDAEEKKVQEEAKAKLVREAFEKTAEFKIGKLKKEVDELEENKKKLTEENNVTLRDAAVPYSHERLEKWIKQLKNCKAAKDSEEGILKDQLIEILETMYKGNDITHVDFNVFKNPNIEKLVNKKPPALRDEDKVLPDYLIDTTKDEFECFANDFKGDLIQKNAKQIIEINKKIAGKKAELKALLPKPVEQPPATAAVPQQQAHQPPKAEIKPEIIAPTPAQALKQEPKPVPAKPLVTEPKKIQIPKKEDKKVIDNGIDETENDFVAAAINESLNPTDIPKKTNDINDAFDEVETNLALEMSYTQQKNKASDAPVQKEELSPDKTDPNTETQEAEEIEENNAVDTVAENTDTQNIEQQKPVDKDRTAAPKLSGFQKFMRKLAAPFIFIGNWFKNCFSKLISKFRKPKKLVN